MNNKKFVWRKNTTDEFIAETPDDETATTAPLCPTCHKPTDEWEGQVDEDEWGNPVYAWHWFCYDCQIGTQLVYLD